MSSRDNVDSSSLGRKYPIFVEITFFGSVAKFKKAETDIDK
ncbi:hypothetical protein [Bacillus pseudomycoides]|nr:hypothetical protein [Bacillus pseudomycoides]